MLETLKTPTLLDISNFTHTSKALGSDFCFDCYQVRDLEIPPSAISVSGNREENYSRRSLTESSASIEDASDLPRL